MRFANGAPLSAAETSSSQSSRRAGGNSPASGNSVLLIRALRTASASWPANCHGQIGEPIGHWPVFRGSRSMPLGSTRASLRPAVLAQELDRAVEARAHVAEIATESHDRLSHDR